MDSERFKTKELQSKMYLTQTHWTHKMYLTQTHWTHESSQLVWTTWMQKGQDYLLLLDLRDLLSDDLLVIQHQTGGSTDNSENADRRIRI